MKTYLEYFLYGLLIVLLIPVYIVLAVLWIISGIGVIIFTLVSGIYGVIREGLSSIHKNIRIRKYERERKAVTYVYTNEEEGN